MLKIGQNWGKITNYPPQCSTKIGTTGISPVVLLAEQLLLFCLKLTWCFVFFSEYKITHQQASFECVDSVFTHCLLACCFKSNHNWTIAWMLENLHKFFRCLLGQANLVNKTAFRIGFKLHTRARYIKKSKNCMNFWIGLISNYFFE